MIPEPIAVEIGGRAAPTARTWRGPGGYVALVAIQTLGVGIVIVNGLPIYRQIVRDFAGHKPQSGVVWWAIAALAAMQTAYWLRVWLQPPMPRITNVVIGHITGFVARLSFILPSSFFSVAFFVRFEELHFSLLRVSLFLGLLFGFFCYTLELERLSRALQETGRKA